MDAEVPVADGAVDEAVPGEPEARPERMVPAHQMFWDRMRWTYCARSKAPGSCTARCETAPRAASTDENPRLSSQSSTPGEDLPELRDPALHEGRGELDHLRACEELLQDARRVVDAGRGGEVRADAPVEERDPAERDERLRGRRERHRGDRHHLLERDVRLEEPVEEDEPVRAGLVEPRREVREGGEVRRELHRHRDPHRAADAVDDLEVARLDLRRGDRRVRLHRVEVHLERVRPRLLDVPGVLGPAPRGAAVEARDHRDLEGLLRALDEGEVLVRPDPLRREVGARLGARLGAAGELLVEGGAGRLDLLLEERAQHHRPRAVPLRHLEVLHAVRQGGAGEHERRRELEAHVVRGEVGHAGSPVARL